MTRNKKDDKTLLLLLGGGALLYFLLNKKGAEQPTGDTLPDPDGKYLDPAFVPAEPQIPIAAILPAQPEYLAPQDNGTLTVKNPAMYVKPADVNNGYYSGGKETIMSDYGSNGNYGVKQAYLAPDGVTYADGWNPNNLQ